MTLKSRNTIKTFFKSGRRPSGGNFADFIDSNLILNSNNTGNITMSGDISSSGTILAKTLVGHIITTEAVVDSPNITSTSHITASNNISASGNFIINQITASGNISSSGIIAALTASIGGGIFTSESLRTGIRNYSDLLNIPSGIVSSSLQPFPTFQLNENRFSGVSTNITASGNISASINVIASNLSGNNTGDQSLVHLAVTGSDVEFGKVTGLNISASGNLSANTITIDEYIDPSSYNNDSSTNQFVQLGKPVTSSGAGIINVTGNKFRVKISQEGFSYGTNQDPRVDVFRIHNPSIKADSVIYGQVNSGFTYNYAAAGSNPQVANRFVSGAYFSAIPLSDGTASITHLTNESTGMSSTAASHARVTASFIIF